MKNWIREHLILSKIIIMVLAFGVLILFGFFPIIAVILASLFVFVCVGLLTWALVDWFVEALID